MKDTRLIYKLVALRDWQTEVLRIAQIITIAVITIMAILIVAAVIPRSVLRIAGLMSTTEKLGFPVVAIATTINGLTP